MYSSLLFIILAITLFYLYKRKSSKYNYPPSPPGLPIIGHVHQLIVKNPFKKLSEWANQHGKIYTLNICTTKAIVINEPKLIREILSRTVSTGKFQTDSSLLLSQGPYGVLNAEGQVWSEQRTLCMKKLKEFGFGNKRMETLILSEANEVCNWIKKTNSKNHGKAIIMQPIFLQSVINTVWTMVASTRIKLGDSKIGQLLETWNSTFQHTMRTGLLFLPWLKNVSPKLSGFTAYNDACLDVINYIEKEFLEHENTFLEGVHRDLVDAYIEESGDDSLKWRHAVATVVELFIAASETTGSTLSWILCYLCVNPEIQGKLQDEIDTVIGGNEVGLDDKSRMPYTEAVILEALRMSSLLPIGAMHRLLEDFKFEGYNLPKGLILIPNLYHCHYSKDVWVDPEVFRPERFLEGQGDKLKGYVIPFQLGKRQCVGEPLAKDMLFIYVARIFQLFSVYPDESVTREDYYKPDIGFLLSPPSLGVVIKLRSN